MEALLQLVEHLLLDLLFLRLVARVALQLSALAGLALAGTLITSVVTAPLTMPVTMVAQVARLVYSAMAAMAEALPLGILPMEMLAVVVIMAAQLRAAAAAALVSLGFRQQYSQHHLWTLSRRVMATEPRVPRLPMVVVVRGDRALLLVEELRVAVLAVIMQQQDVPVAAS
jgi:hypothetical protein